MRLVFVAATFLAFVGSPAFAQGTPPLNSSQMDAASSKNDPPPPGAANGQDNAGVRNMAAVQKIREDLQSAGFTDVKVVAESFVVQAKSKDGNPVVMTIGPQGMSVFEAMNNGSSSSRTVGSSSGATSGSEQPAVPDSGTQK
jgi:hypothetical protein